MSLPMLTRCCGCIPLEIGCVLLTLLSIASCIGNILVGALRLPSHKSRQPEDNLICMSMVMFSTLSALTNLMILGGIWAKRPGYLQFAMLFNFLFIMFCFMVGIVTCLFSPEFAPYLTTAGGVALVVAAMLGGAAYCIYFLMVVNSTYRKMKLTYEFSDSAIPV